MEDLHEQETAPSLGDAAWNGDFERVRELVEDHGVDVDAPDDQHLGWTALHCACGGGHLSIVEFLV